MGRSAKPNVNSSWRVARGHCSSCARSSSTKIKSRQNDSSELIIHREKALPPLIASFAHRDGLWGAHLVRRCSGSDGKPGQDFQAVGCGLGRLMASFDHEVVFGTRRLVRTVIGSSRRARTRPPNSRMRARASSSPLLTMRIVSTTPRLVGWSAILTASWDKQPSSGCGLEQANRLFRPSGGLAQRSVGRCPVVTASADNTAKLWEVGSGNLIASFAHQGPVQWAGVQSGRCSNPDSKQDGTAKLWDAASGELMAPLPSG